MLNQKLQQKLIQKLSPQQIQLIKLLEIPTIELDQRIKKELEENPVLEDNSEDDHNEQDDSDDNNSLDEERTQEEVNKEQDEFSIEDYMDDDDIPDYKLNANNYSKDDKRVEIPYSGDISFNEILTTQLDMHFIEDKMKGIGAYIIGNMDDDGYLRRELDAIVDDLAFSQGIDTTRQELEEVLKIIQNFDPPGIGARTLQECLMIQAYRKHKSKPKDKPSEHAYNILKDHFLEFTKKHYKKIASRMGISEKELKEAIDEILKLNPKPGSALLEQSEKTFQQIIPDFIIEVVDNEINLTLNSKNAPELRINSTYMNMLENYQSNKKNQNKNSKEAVAFVKQKLDSAKWFIDAIKQRQDTLMHTMRAILLHQKEFFIEGDPTKMHPMILKDIAEKTNLDISTISRVANSKYIQTHFGIFPLKYFFSEGMQTFSGEEVSTREIKSILSECIENEKKGKPLTDDRLSKILQKKGYNIARRTVAKYREQLNIPVARMRKEL